MAFSGFSQDPIKRVLVEEFTGTWCASCGYGGIYFKHLEDNYPNAIPVAIHNGFMVDPMEILEIEIYMVDYFGGSPTFLFDRTDFAENSQTDASISASNTWEHGLDTLDYYMEKLYNEAPLATIGISQTFDPSTRLITATITSNFIDNANGNFRLNCFIVEDSVTGGTEYDQSNQNFSGWTGAPSYLQELVDQPAIISGYVHNHVLRGMLGNPEGVSASIPTSVIDGDSYSKEFTYTLPDDYDANQISLVGVLQRYGSNKITDREIVNANSQKLLSGPPTSTASLNKEFIDLKVYPNPISEGSKIEFYAKESGNISCTLYNTQGQKIKDIFHENFVQGEYSLNLGIKNLDNGIYFLKFSNKKYNSIKRIIVTK